MSPYFLLSQELGGMLLPTVVIFGENILALKYQLCVENSFGGAIFEQERLTEI